MPKKKRQPLAPKIGNGQIQSLSLIAWRCDSCYRASTWRGRPTLKLEPSQNTRPGAHACPRCGKPWDRSDHKPRLVSAAL